MVRKRNTSAQQNHEPLDLDQSTGHLIRIAHRLFQQALQARLAEHGVKLSHWHCLRYLMDEDGLTQKELSKRVRVKESTIVAVIQEMEHIGLIKRIRTPLDRRKYALSLTAKAKRITRNLLPIAREVNKKGTKNMTAKETKLFNSMTQNIIDNLNDTQS